MTTAPAVHARRTFALRGVAALAVGTLVAVFAPRPAGAGAAFAIVVGYIVAMLLLVLPLVRDIVRMDPDQTRLRVGGLDASRSAIDVGVIAACLGSLAAVTTMLLSAKASFADLAAVVALLGVATSWVAVHAMFTLRYARHILNFQPDSVDFNQDAPLRMSDFAYLAFTLGMTYQVSDTNLKTPQVRRLVLEHTLLSYVFGTGIVAATINVVAGLAGSGN